VVGLVVLGALVAACSSSGGQSSQSIRGGAIEGRNWRVMAYVDANGAMKDAYVTVPLDARFEGGTVAGSSGCTAFTASYAISGGNLTVSGLQAPTVSCDAWANEARTLYMAALPLAATFGVAGTKLTIYNAGGNEVLRFEERP
jgi:heat shock protein HslJ